ncbi:MAG TPA: hypothetical protein EYN66_10840 [Myxococcales bacterium]|nr:hypothetical protein [Myxococcales bacterium]
MPGRITIALVGFLLVGACSEPQERPLDILPSTVADSLCVAMQLPRGADEDAQYRRLESLRLLSEAGVGVIRTDILWHEVEAQEGQFNWAGYDRVISAAQEQSIRIIGLLAYGNSWAAKDTEDDPTYPPDDPQDFARHGANVAERYGTALHSLEVWNEPNLWIRFWKSVEGGADPARYAALLRATAKAIRETDASIPILFGGTFFHELPQVMPGSVSFVGDAHLADPELGQYYDGLAYHPYTNYPPQAAPESDEDFEIPLTVMAEQLRDLLQESGNGQKAIHISEVGWPIYGEVEESTQAAYLVRAHLLALAQQTQTVCWYTLRDGVVAADGGFTVAPEHAFGLVRHDYTPKAAYFALRTLNTALGASRFVSLSHLDGVYRAVFEEADESEWHALWTVGEPVDWTLQLSPGHQLVRGVSLTGEVIELTGNTVHLTASPSYYQSAP